MSDLVDWNGGEKERLGARVRWGIFCRRGDRLVQVDTEAYRSGQIGRVRYSGLEGASIIQVIKGRSIYPSGRARFAEEQEFGSSKATFLKN